MEIGEKEKVFEDYVFIENTRFGINSKNAGRNLRGRSFTQVT